MAGKSAYDILIEMGAPPEKVISLMNKAMLSDQNPLLENQPVGYRGNTDAISGVQMSSVPRGVRGATFNKPGVSSKLSYMQQGIR